MSLRQHRSKILCMPLSHLVKGRLMPYTYDCTRSLGNTWNALKTLAKPQTKAWGETFLVLIHLPSAIRVMGVAYPLQIAAIHHCSSQSVVRRGATPLWLPLRGVHGAQQCVVDSNHHQ
jgi:hypothetical protein